MMEKKPLAVQRCNVTDQIFQLLKEKIVQGVWLPGDRIPSENDLARDFSVSRMSVRMALQKLVALELLEVKNGGGYFVKDFTFRDVVAHVSGMMLHNISYEDFNQFRALVEIHSLELLRKKSVHPRDLKRLTEHCDAMRKAMEQNDPQAFALADYQFHRLICELSGNGLFVYSYDLLGPLFLEYLSQHYDETKLTPSIRNLLPQGDNHYATALAQHENIICAIREGRIDDAMAIVSQFTHQTF